MVESQPRPAIMSRPMNIDRSGQRQLNTTSTRRSPMPSSPSYFGPHTQTVHEPNYRTPTLAYFLNTYVKPQKVSQLDAIHHDCSDCGRRMCDDIHRPVPDAAAPPTPPPLPPRNPGRIQCLPDRTRRQPNGPDAPTPCTPVDACPDRARCEVGVKITTPGCDHVLGSSCLAAWLTLGGTRCPVCGTVWFERVDGPVRTSVMREAWPWSEMKLPVGGGAGKRERDGESCV
jgi:hypothetical protein